MIHKMRQFISYFALLFMKGVQVQLTSFMSSVYITEDRINFSIGIDLSGPDPTGAEIKPN